MKKTIVLFLVISQVVFSQTDCVVGFAGSFPCNDYDLMNHFDKETLSTSNGSDIWGWTDPSTNKEYAITTFGDKTCFIDVTDPINPVYLGFLNSNITTITRVWRDVKVYNNHAFIVADNVGTHGMQVFDLTRLRSVSSPPQNFSHDALLTTGLNGSTLGSCHNIVINEAVGVAYLVGCNLANGGPVMVDISDPKNPVTVGQYANDGYTHDAQVVTYNGPDTDYTNKQILVASNGSSSGTNKVVIVDVTDPAAPTKIADVTYTNTKYTHQGWFTADQKYFLVNDELDEQELGNNTRTLIFDLTDLDNPTYHSEFLNTTASIDHNLYVKGNLVFQANYTSGLRVLDISDINNISEIGYFDTYPANNNASFNGIWSVYPYFSSGNIIISDYNSGFLIVRKSGTLGGNQFELTNTAVRLYPNPSNKNITIELSDDTLLHTVEVYSLVGQKVFEKNTIQQSTFVIPTTRLSRGIYMVKINNTVSKKIVLY